MTLKKQPEKFCDNPRCPNHKASLMPGYISQKINGVVLTFRRVAINGKHVCTLCTGTFDYVKELKDEAERQSKSEGTAKG